MEEINSSQMFKIIIVLSFDDLSTLSIVTELNNYIVNTIGHYKNQINEEHTLFVFLLKDTPQLSCLISQFLHIYNVKKENVIFRPKL